MYDENIEVGIISIKVHAKTVDSTVRKATEVILQIPFTESIARDLGQESTLKSLKDLSIEQAKIMVDEIDVLMQVCDPDGERTIPVRGKTATCSMSNENEPIIKMSVISRYDENDLIYLVRLLTCWVGVRFSKKQLSLIEDAV